MNGAQAAALALPVLVGLGLIGIAALVARTGWQHRHNRIFATLYLLSGINSIGQGVLAQASAPDGTPIFRPDGVPAALADTFHATASYFPAQEVWLVLNLACVLLMLPLLFLFVLNFPRPLPWVARRPRLQGLAFSVTAVFGLLFGAILARLPLGGSFLSALIDLQAPLHAFNLLATAVTLAATFLLWRTHALSPSAIERRQAGYLIVGFLPAFAATGAITLLGFLFGDGAAVYQVPVIYYISPPLELAAAAVTAFAILKYRLLDFELQVKGGMRYAILTVILGAAIFAVEVYVGNFVLQAQVFSFLGPAGSAALAAASGLLLFKPVHKVSGKLTDRLFPEAAAPKVDYERSRAREIYQVQATHVLRDAKVTDREMAFLRTLRDQLGLAETEARAIEEGVERNLGVDDARTGQEPTPAEAPAPEPGLAAQPK